VDQTVKRVEVGGFAYPLGVYPAEPVEPAPRAGYTTAFEPADDGSEEPGEASLSGVEESEEPPREGPAGGWEEWPDRYVYDILVPATRVESLVRTLLALLPGRVFPILDFLGQDEWREVDPYVSYDLIGMDRFMESLRRFRGFFYEDGLVGFGAMSEEPFLYVFVDEHKVVTVRVEADWKERVEKVLAAFDLEPIEELLSADSVTHEHRSVLETADDRPDLLNADEIIEVLKDEWRLVLNIDPETNVDEEGHDLGITGWRCILRCDPEGPGRGVNSNESTVEEAARILAEAAQKTGEDPKASVEEPAPKYIEVFLTADSYRLVGDLAIEAIEKLFERDGVEIDADSTPEPVMVIADRWNTDDFIAAVEKATGQKPDMLESGSVHAAWLN
jgi:hypothetical protein